ncbi:MAG: AAA family ATPase [Firmicutes bacterium]|nr:AAA family ATPase [Bacillota bacterium]
MGVSASYEEAMGAVLGSLLIDPGPVSGIVFDRLRPEDFREEYRTVFEACRGLWLEGRAIDPVAVIHAAGSAYDGDVRRWMRQTPTAANVDAYCRIVREESGLDRLRSLGAGLIGAADLKEARSLIAEAEGTIMERPDVRAWSVPELLAEFISRDPKKPAGYLKWGIRQLDAILTAEPGDFIILGADSSVGKTALACQMAWAMAGAGRRVGFFSLETSARKLTDRIVARTARVKMHDIKHATLSPEDFREVGHLGTAVQTLPLWIIEAAGMNVADLRAVTVSKRYEVIFIDYLQLLQAEGRERWEIVTNISMQLHTLAQTLGVAVVALSQITAADKSKKARQQPTKDDLRESKQLKQDADLILMLALSDPEDNDSLRWLSVAKNKDGPLGQVCLRFDPEHMEFTPTDSRAWRRPAGQKKEDPGFVPVEDPQEVLPF